MRSAWATSDGGSPGRRGPSTAFSGRPRRPAPPQVVECAQVRIGEILDVNVVAHAGAVRGRVVGAEDRDVRALADRPFASDPGGQVAVERRLADAPARIRAGDVEVTQHYVTQVSRGAEIAQHPFAHQLRRAVR